MCRVAHLLTDLEPEPPLKPAVDAAGTLSIAIGLQVPGEPTGLGAPNPGTWHSAPEGSQVEHTMYSCSHDLQKVHADHSKHSGGVGDSAS